MPLCGLRNLLTSAAGGLNVRRVTLTWSRAVASSRLVGKAGVGSPGLYVCESHNLKSLESYSLAVKRGACFSPSPTFWCVCHRHWASALDALRAAAHDTFRDNAMALLHRSDLTPAEAALQTARRKEIYEALHPQAKHGSNQHTRSSQFANSYADDQALKTGSHPSTVRRDAARGEALGEDLEAIAGTSLDKGVELDALAKLPEQERKSLVQRAKSGEQVSARSANIDADVKVRAAREAVSSAPPLQFADRIFELRLLPFQPRKFGRAIVRPI